MKQVFYLGILLTSSILSATPVLEFNFDKLDSNKKNFLSTNNKYKINASCISNNGFNQNGAKISNQRHYGFNLKEASLWNSFTVELKFRLDNQVDKKVGNALFCYAKNNWNRSQFVLGITPQGQLLANFNQSEPKKSLTVKSKKISFEIGKFYTVRIASQAGKQLKIFLDGELVAIKEKDSWGFNSLKTNKTPPGYPLFTLGSDLAKLPKVYRPLNGVIDDVKIWNTFKEPDILNLTSQNNNDSTLLVTKDKVVITSKATVLDRPGKLPGTFVKPEQKYLDAAAHAELQLTDNNLIVKVIAPIAIGTTLDKSAKNTWNGDAIEFFFLPDTKKKQYFHYTANVGGFSAAKNFSSQNVSNPKFKSNSKISATSSEKSWIATFVIPRKEISIAGNINGKISKINFTRTGKTGGGQSTWAPTGKFFHSPSKFRQIVFGSYQVALLNKLSHSRNELKQINGKKELKSAISKELDFIEKQIKEKSDGKNFAAISNAIDKMAIRFTQLKFSGAPCLIWKPTTIWGNETQVTQIAQQLDKITIELPQNSYTYTGFVFSNLSDTPFLGQIKCFTSKRAKEKKIINYFNNSIAGDISPIYKNVKFFEVLPILTNEVLLDPLLPLHMNTILRANNKESKQILMRISSNNMPVGNHNFVMCLKPAYKVFAPIEIPIEIKIKNVDLKDIKLDSFHYTHVNTNFITNKGTNEELIKVLAQKELNVIYFGAIVGSSKLDIYPKANNDGTIISYSDYNLIDQVIQSKIKHGIEKERIKLIFFLELPSYGMRKAGNNLKFNTPEWKKAFKSFLNHFANHLENKHQITRDRIILYTVDEPDGDINNKSSKMYKAYLAGKIIKEIDPKFPTMVNPIPYYLRGQDTTALKKLAETHDILELYRPGIKQRHLDAIKNRYKEIWTYGIYQKVDKPTTYRREYWQSLYNNFSSMISYWHLDSHAGGDGFNSNDGASSSRIDYGSMYMDMDMGTYLTSKREEAHALGFEDFKLAEYCKQILKKRPNKTLQKELDLIIKDGSTSDMEGMEQCRIKLLQLAEKLQK